MTNVARSLLNRPHVRVVEGPFPKVAVGVDEGFVLVERAAFLIGFVHHVTDSLVTGFEI